VSPLYTLSTWVIPMVVSITFHEAAHGFAADRFGDATARKLGRMSLNPIRHVDPVGSVLLPAFLAFTGAPVFGWAKPVPVDPRNFVRPVRDMAWVAAAGPAMNLLLAILAAALLSGLLHLNLSLHDWLSLNLINALIINLFLMALNLLPVPPLDGSKVMMAVLPNTLARHYARLEKFGLLLVIGLLILVPMLFKVDPVGALLGRAVDVILRGLLALTGLQIAP
jgi:Zn-dependent protease